MNDDVCRGMMNDDVISRLPVCVGLGVERSALSVAT